MQRESKIYLYFFRANWLMILIPTLIAIILTFYLLTTQKSKVVEKSLFEMNDRITGEQSQVTKTDEAVTGARFAVAKPNFLTIGNTATIYKSGPLGITVEVTGADRSVIIQDSKTIELVLQNKYNFKLTDTTFSDVKNNKQILYILIFPLMGFSVGVLLSCIKTYFQKY